MVLGDFSFTWEVEKSGGAKPKSIAIKKFTQEFMVFDSGIHGHRGLLRLESFLVHHCFLKIRELNAGIVDKRSLRMHFKLFSICVCFCQGHLTPRHELRLHRASTLSS